MNSVQDDVMRARKALKEAKSQLEQTEGELRNAEKTQKSAQTDSTAAEVTLHKIQKNLDASKIVLLDLETQLAELRDSLPGKVGSDEDCEVLADNDDMHACTAANTVKASRKTTTQRDAQNGALKEGYEKLENSLNDIDISPHNKQAHAQKCKSDLQEPSSRLRMEQYSEPPPSFARPAVIEGKGKPITTRTRPGAKILLWYNYWDAKHSILEISWYSSRNNVHLCDCSECKSCHLTLFALRMCSHLCSFT